MDSFLVFLHALYQMVRKYFCPEIIINISVATQLASVQLKGRLSVTNNYLSNFANVLLRKWRSVNKHYLYPCTTGDICHWRWKVSEGSSSLPASSSVVQQPCRSNFQSSYWSLSVSMHLKPYLNLFPFKVVCWGQHCKKKLFQDRVRIGHPHHPATSPEDSLLQESCMFPVHDLLLDRAIP